MNENRAPHRRDLSRREFVQGSALAGFAVFLAACGRAGTSAAPSTAASAAAPSVAASAAPSASVAPTPVPSMATELNWANWTYYMDVDEATGKFPTLEQFKEKYGTTVKYEEIIDDNDLFVGTIKPQLEAGQDTGWDLMCLTDWMAARLIRLGWVEQMDLGNMPNVVANLQDVYKNVTWDPTNDHHVPWQSGMTGIGYDKNKTGDQDSIDVFFTDEFKGKLTYLSEMRDTIGLAAIRLGDKPEELTQEQFDKALAEVDKAIKSGVVRQVTGNSYVEDMAGGGVILAMAWSGDVLTLLVPDQKPDQDFQWALPKEGGMLWTDNMVIPKGTPNKAQAERWIDFYYEPQNAATIEAYVNYVCPVKGAKEVMLESSPELADNPLIFPPDDWTARLHQFRATTAEEEMAWSEAFTKAMGL